MSSVAAADKPASAQNAQPAATRACEREGCTNAARSHCGKCRAVHYCGRECQQAAWPAHKWLCNPCVRIARGPASGVDDGRGARLVALKQFKEGDELARERPFARIAHADSVHATEAEAKRWGEGLWDDHVTTMSPGAERDLLYGLTDAWNDPPTAGGIARTNCLPLGDHNDSEGSGLFALICRANHACRPNARYIWRHDLQRELLLAVRDIAPGDEVTVTYGTSTEGRAQRQATLLRGFRFECKCELCETGDAPGQDAGAHRRARRRDSSRGESQPQAGHSHGHEGHRALRIGRDGLGLLPQAVLARRAPDRLPAWQHRRREPLLRQRAGVRAALRGRHHPRGRAPSSLLGSWLSRDR
jgi:hypothetical protein